MGHPTGYIVKINIYFYIFVKYSSISTVCKRNHEKPCRNGRGMARCPNTRGCPGGWERIVSFEGTLPVPRGDSGGDSGDGKCYRISSKFRRKETSHFRHRNSHGPCLSLVAPCKFSKWMFKRENSAPEERSARNLC